MKKILLIVLIILFASSLFGELPRTKTIGTDTLSVIRSACQGNDQLIRHYYLEYKGNSKYDEETGEEMYDEQGKGQTFGTTTYLKRSFLGALIPNNLTAAKHLFHLTHVDYNKYFV